MLRFWGSHVETPDILEAFVIRRTVAAFCFLVTMCSVASGQSGLSAAWEELHVDPAPTHRQGHLFIAGQDRLFVFGGNDGARVVNDFWAFDPVGVGWAYLELPEDVAFLRLSGRSSRLRHRGRDLGTDVGSQCSARSRRRGLRRHRRR